MPLLVLCVSGSCLLPVADASANTSHAGWPRITGVLILNSLDHARPIDLRPGHDPFDGTDPTYSCDQLHTRRVCFPGHGPAVVPSDIGHDELLGGHGNDRIYAGPEGDVLWGDYKPSSQPTTQTDHLFGGPGNDFIYASHGINDIDTGPGRDIVHAHFGRGRITCGSSATIVFLSHKSRPHYRLTGCKRISYFTVGY
ncbi:MAG TPA: hypothetical protein VLJ42_10095 [Solirubrobacteraceae bacterium]|nr:hypothetical protein [Solirubrobacteraceae bacterium]